VLTLSTPIAILLCPENSAVHAKLTCRVVALVSLSREQWDIQDEATPFSRLQNIVALICLIHNLGSFHPQGESGRKLLGKSYHFDFPIHMLGSARTMFYKRKACSYVVM
jgi:hypothetical protein